MSSFQNLRDAEVEKLLKLNICSKENLQFVDAFVDPKSKDQVSEVMDLLHQQNINSNINSNNKYIDNSEYKTELKEESLIQNKIKYEKSNQILNEKCKEINESLNINNELIYNTQLILSFIENEINNDKSMNNYNQVSYNMSKQDLIERIKQHKINKEKMYENIRLFIYEKINKFKNKKKLLQDELHLRRKIQIENDNISKSKKFIENMIVDEFYDGNINGLNIPMTLRHRNLQFIQQFNENVCNPDY